MANIEVKPSKFQYNLQHVLPSFADEAKGVVNALVEINPHTINKYEFITESGQLKLDRVGYSSLAYPLAYGLIPQTWDADNDMLDIADAFVREASASMDYASRGKYFRKILARGLPGSFRRSATVINAGTDSLGRRVVEIAGLAKQFGTHLDEVAGSLMSAATDLESDAGQMAAAAETTNRQTSGMRNASDQASSNVATVASATTV